MRLLHPIHIGLRGLAASIVLGISSSAAAAPIIDLIDPSDEILLNLGAAPTPCPSAFACSPNTLSYQHNIADDGFDIGIDTLTSATLEVRVYDDGGSEAYWYELGLAAQTVELANIPDPGRTDTILLNLPSLADLAADGIIGVTLTLKSGTSTQEGLYFDWSKLTVQVDGGSTLPPTQVPAPGSLLLMAGGIAGLAWRRRR